MTRLEEIGFIKEQRQLRKTYQEIADLLGVTKQAVHSRCQYYGITKPTKPVPPTYQAKVQARIKKNSTPQENGCWEWNTALSHEGYGRTSYKGEHEYAHRISYTVFKGNIPTGMYVCHSCDNRKCVNPEHLWLGTHRANMDDMMQKRELSSTKPV